MQEKLNVQATQNGDMSLEQPFEDNGPGISVSEQSIAEQPFHLRLLFQNDWLSIEGPSESRVRQGHGITSTAHPLAVARKSLQVLIPSKDEILKTSDSASEWLSMLQSFFPLPCGTTCGEEVVAGYEEMHSPNVDPIKLASWMVTVAMITEQLPQENVRMEIRLKNRQRHSSLSKAISTTVENKVLAYDTLTGSIEGLSLLMQFIRLEMGRGNIHKAWLKLRRAIAIAELMGLHNLVQVIQMGSATEAADEGYIGKLRLWDLICAADRLLGMILNISPITGRHEQLTNQSLSINGIVQTRLYLFRLTDIANKIQDLDLIRKSNVPGTESYAFALELSRELKALASQTPEAWWSGGVHGANNVQPDHIVQFLHYYVAMRIHLPLSLRQGPDGENLFNCLACVAACESMVQRYQLLRRTLPPGLFLSEILDIQAFSAAVTLLLISHMFSQCSLEVGIDKIKIKNEVGQVIQLLQDKSDCPSGSCIAYNGFTTLRSLDDLLGENGFDVCQIAFHAPLLGKMQVKRNEQTSQSEDDWSSDFMSALGLCNAGEQIFQLNPDSYMSLEPSIDLQNM
ncbi:hypothetical protein N7517_008104 [Penicillium concentricum]|uniref:Transcription factor domain-containing protein n=1 Tax=Penicillium concentricum TaxID=293559 RepID=A0A9W9RWP5_9EURO|nr:uncharacterized protein N7517_008104 [Penicillium concentricum]KAJ5365218.1 hypothetical protein N7517_008104 [Penicillium concentricum]